MLRLFFGTFIVLFIVIVVLEISTVGAVGNLPAALMEALQSFLMFVSTFQVLA